MRNPIKAAWSSFVKWRGRKINSNYRSARPQCQEWANAACIAARSGKNVERCGVLAVELHARPVGHQYLWIVEIRGPQERRLRIYDAIFGRYIGNVNAVGRPLIAYEGPALAWNAHPDAREVRADDIYAKIINNEWEWRVGVRA